MNATNKMIAEMTAKQLAEKYELSVQNGWVYANKAKLACASGKENELFDFPKRRATAAPATAAKASSPLTMLDAKTTVIAQLIAINRGVVFSSDELKIILENSMPAELAMLDDKQVAYLREWAKVKTNDQYTKEYIDQVEQDELAMLRSLNQREYLINRGIDHGDDRALITVFNELKKIFMSDD